MKYPAEAHAWHKNSNYLCQLSIENEHKLEMLALKAEVKGIKVMRFYEPDLGNRLTSIALEPGETTKKLTSHLPLMLREKEQELKVA